MAMETVAVGGTKPEMQKKNRIQVSNTKKPLFFYVNLAKRYIQQHNEVELSALGMEVLTSTVGMKDEAKGRLIQKARIEIVLGKTEKFDSLITATTAAAPEAAADNKDGNKE
ncbi:alba DNA/RNA-binding protein [Actinidia rufa]|uniref:Alba DNA/RNA-binding protein n=1 Tax=Actinidia rufa TaxID=165716 RepID=A0A7J0E010_9ERIC|nr:alba DNA/RNA-binding protein [Actinidia rufa]